MLTQEGDLHGSRMGRRRRKGLVAWRLYGSQRGLRLRLGQRQGPRRGPRWGRQDRGKGGGGRRGRWGGRRWAVHQHAPTQLLHIGPVIGLKVLQQARLSCKTGCAMLLRTHEQGGCSGRGRPSRHVRRGVAHAQLPHPCSTGRGARSTGTNHGKTKNTSYKGQLRRSTGHRVARNKAKPEQARLRRRPRRAKERKSRTRRQNESNKNRAGSALKGARKTNTRSEGRGEGKPLHAP